MKYGRKSKLLDLESVRQWNVLSSREQETSKCKTGKQIMECYDAELERTTDPLARM